MNKREWKLRGNQAFAYWYAIHKTYLSTKYFIRIGSIGGRSILDLLPCSKWICKFARHANNHNIFLIKHLIQFWPDSFNQIIYSDWLSDKASWIYLASRFISTEDMKQTFTLISITNIFSHHMWHINVNQQKIIEMWFEFW
jgi:hypothetical protein